MTKTLARLAAILALLALPVFGQRTNPVTPQWRKYTLQIVNNGTNGCAGTAVGTAMGNNLGYILTTGGTFTGSGAGHFEVEIDGNGTPDTFKWRKNGGTYTTGVAITGSAQLLSNGVTVDFSSHTTGNDIGHRAEFFAGSCWVSRNYLGQVLKVTPMEENMDYVPVFNISPNTVLSQFFIRVPTLFAPIDDASDEVTKVGLLDIDDGFFGGTDGASVSFTSLDNNVFSIPACFSMYCGDNTPTDADYSVTNVVTLKMQHSYIRPASDGRIVVWVLQADLR